MQRWIFLVCWGMLVVCKLQNAPLYGQQDFARSVDVHVYQGVDTLYNAWSGGLNNPQIWPSPAGPDYVVFDREGNYFLQFDRKGHYWKEVHTLPKPNFSHWMVPKTLGDGTPFFMTGTFRGRTPGYRLDATASGWQWVPLFDSIAFQDNGSKLLTVGFIDIPGLVDVNGDGDVDILNFEPLGGFVDYFENQAIEGGHPESDFVIALEDRCWGDFYESGLTRSMALDSCVDDRFGKQPGVRHAGSTVTPADFNHDGLVDLILGDLNFATLNHLINGGTPAVSDVVAQDTLFPANQPAILPNFPAAFVLDVNRDSLPDVVAAPNSESGSLDIAQVWYYKNTGTRHQPSFVLEDKSFLVGSMIDVGSQAFPHLWDYNKDGLMDLLIGSAQRHPEGSVTYSSLTLYENVGTPTQPQFQWVTDDFAQLRQYQLLGLSPTTADIDDDGDDDLVIGDADGRLHLVVQTAPGQWTLTGPQWFGIDVGTLAAPILSDRDADGLLDLVVGERNGNLNFFKNTGTATQPQFSTTPDDDFYGRVDARPGFQPFGKSFPCLLRFEGNSSEEQLLVGTTNGHLMRYTEIDQPVFNEADTVFKNIDVGSYAAPSAGDINGDGLADLIVGTGRGGVTLFIQQPATSIAKASLPTLKVFPQPAADWISLGNKTNGYCTIYTTTFQPVKTVQLSGGRLPVHDLPTGTYVMEWRYQLHSARALLIIAR